VRPGFFRPATYLCAVALAALVASCGGDVVSFDNVAGAAVRTEDAGSARFHLEGAVTVNHDHAQQFSFTADGVADWRTWSASMRGKYTFPSAVEEALGGRTGFRMIMDGRKGFLLYMKLSFLQRELPKGRPWMKLDLQKIGKAAGVNFRDLVQGRSSDPAQMLQYIRAVGEVERIGTDLVQRELTTHYHADVNINKVIALTPAAQRKAVREMLKKLKRTGYPPTYPMDIWIGRDDGLVHKVEYSFEFIDRKNYSVEVEISEELYDFGAPVTVKPPARAHVYDATDLAIRCLCKRRHLS
jgi:hypothetical protein